MRNLFLSIVVFMLILNTSIPCYAANTTISWTEKELKFMENHPVIFLGVDPSFIPFEFIDTDGEYKGITPDYLKLLSERTGLEFEIVPDLTWSEAYEKAIEGEIDVLPAISKTADREQYFLFSEPYYYFKRVIVTSDTNTRIKGIEDLEGYTVAVQKNSSHHSYLMSFPRINLSLYESVEDALTAVANGTETAFVGNLATTKALISSSGLNNLKFIAFEADKQQALHFAVRKDYPELVSILNKGLASITEEEKISINNKWVGVDTETDYGPLIRIVLLVGALILIVWLVSIYWIIRLRKEIVKRKKIQDDLQKAKLEAEEANNIKSSFMARMSHEIRTPLNAITGMAYLLKKTNVTLTQKMYVDRITQASINMLNIINDILDFSKIEAGKVELEIIPFSLDQVIQDVVNIVSYKFEEQEIGFKLTKDPKIPNWLYGDAKRLEQILLNIINNAAKFTPSGEVSFDTRLVGKESNKCHLEFTIKDTGIGMSETHVKQLFEPFSQGDVSINRRFGGTGLGLSIVKNLLDMMNGKIQVFSIEGEGSSFVVNLSLEIDMEKEAEYKKQVSADYFKNVKTLVLEKNGASINIIDSYLSAFGVDCELTTSQVSAINMLETANGELQKPFDLFIIDYETPTESGFKFLEALHQNHNIAKKPKVIMLFPMMRDDLFDKLDEYGVDIGVGKPIIPSVLFNGILEIFKVKVIASSQTLKQEVLNQGNSCEEIYNILVVEDNKTNQLIAKSLLQQAGFTVWLASDGKEGVLAFSEHQQEIDLILMDLHMPVMSGYDASIEIRQMSKSIPIVAMTADVVQGVKEKCEAHGIHHYISKPFDPEGFVKTITDIIKTSETGYAAEEAVLDQSSGLKYLGNNIQLYEMVLQEYYHENQDTNEKLSVAIDEKRYAEARQIVHKIKSSSGSIGAKKLHIVAVNLQKSLEENKEIEIVSLYQEFKKLLKEVLHVIEIQIKDSSNEK